MSSFLRFTELAQAAEGTGDTAVGGAGTEEGDEVWAVLKLPVRMKTGERI